jgi:UDP-GlcNAc3NAcA epimerase
MKIVTVIGARPQIIKAAALSRAILNSGKAIQEVIVHTGQHYDHNMSGIFITEMGIPKPDYNMGVGSGSHGAQTAQMIEKLEEILLIEQPDYLVVYGDTNSTLAAAIAGSKIHIPIVHIEAGLRSFNKRMPEEINRILCDHVSTLLFSPTDTGFKNLLNEGFKKSEAPFNPDNPGIFKCGDLMYDNSLYFAQQVADNQFINSLNLQNKPYALVTIHRNDNTDDKARLNGLFEAIVEVAHEHQLNIVLPLHPRTRKMMEQFLEPHLQEKLNLPEIHIIEPASFLQMIELEKNATLVMTDSGGVQKEAYFFQKPCIILRPETEWIELVQNGAALICDANKEKIKNAATYFMQNLDKINFSAIFGDGNAAGFIVETLWNQKSR